MSVNNDNAVCEGYTASADGPGRIENVEQKTADAGKMAKVLDKCYEISLEGLPKLETAEELAERYIQKYPDDSEKAVKEFIKWQLVKCGTSSFATSFGGILTMIATMPAYAASAIYLQIRTAVCIAIICGYDPRDEKIKAVIYSCLLGKSIKNVMQNVLGKVGDKVISKVGGKAICKASEKVLERSSGRITTAVAEKITALVSAKMAVRVGGKSALARVVPIIGGGVMAAADVYGAKQIADNAVDMFVKKQIEEYL